MLGNIDASHSQASPPPDSKVVDLHQRIASRGVAIITSFRIITTRWISSMFNANGKFQTYTETSVFDGFV